LSVNREAKLLILISSWLDNIYHKRMKVLQNFFVSATEQGLEKTSGSKKKRAGLGDSLDDPIDLFLSVQPPWFLLRICWALSRGYSARALHNTTAVARLPTTETTAAAPSPAATTGTTAASAPRRCGARPWATSPRRPRSFETWCLCRDSICWMECSVDCRVYNSTCTHDPSVNLFPANMLREDQSFGSFRSKNNPLLRLLGWWLAAWCFNSFYANSEMFFCLLICQTVFVLTSCILFL
jgi:hypothetical protein